MRTPERIAYDDNPEGLERELAPGGGFVVERDEAGVVSVRAAATWELVARFQARGTIDAFAVSMDGARVALVDERARVAVHEAATGALVRRLEGVPCGWQFPARGEEPASSSALGRHIALSPDNDAVLVYSARARGSVGWNAPPDPPLGVYLCELAEGRAPQRLPGGATSVQFSLDGRWIPLVVEGRVALWDRELGALGESLTARRERMVFRMTEQGERVWDPEHARFRDEMWRWTELYRARLGESPPAPEQIALSRDGGVIAWLRGELLEYGPTRGPDTGVFRGERYSNTRPVALDGRGELLAVGAEEGPAAAPLLRLMHLPTREVVMLRLSAHYPRIEHPYAMAFDERGALCVLCAGGEFSVFEPAR